MKTLKELQAVAAANREPVKKSITYKMGDEGVSADIHVKRLSVKDYEALYIGGTSDNRIARSIHIGVMVEDDKGRPVPIPLDLAEQLPPTLACAMFEAFSEVNVTKKS